MEERGSRGGGMGRIKRERREGIDMTLGRDKGGGGKVGETERPMSTVNQNA